MAIIPIENRQDRYLALKEAFIDATFQEEIDNVQEDLVYKIKEYVKKLRNIDDRIDNVFSITARKKGVDNFLEKVRRKDYLRKWTIYDDIDENKNTIKYQLTDLIGIRVNCNFGQYSKPILDHFKKCDQDSGLMPNFEFSFDENTTMQNGFDIFKFSGRYKNTYRFEVQIKHMLEGIWGEVEHKSVYKSTSYDAYYEKKKELTESLHEIMNSSDKELYCIFKMEESEDQLLRSWFFLKTHNIVMEQVHTEILAVHYSHYFDTFDYTFDVKEYVAKNLLEQEWAPKNISEDKHNKDEACLKYIKDNFSQFYIECLFEIDKILHNHTTYDDFLEYLLYVIISKNQINVPDFDTEMLGPEFCDEDTDENDDDNPVDAGEVQDQEHPSEEIPTEIVDAINSVLGYCKNKDE